MQEIYKVDEAAEKLKINKALVQRLCREGKIQAYREGREWRIPENSLAEYVQNRLQERRK